MTPDLRKYPRMYLIEGSQRHPGDENPAAVPFRAIAGRRLAVEKKVDGANAALRFDANDRRGAKPAEERLDAARAARERHSASRKSATALTTVSGRSRCGQ